MDRDFRRHVRRVAENPVAVALNILICAIVFAPWVRPRETVSGLLGRWAANEAGWKRGLGRRGALLVDWIYAWEPDHCQLAYTLERDARKLR